MIRDAQRSFRILIAGLFMLATLVLFDATAHAHGAPEHAASAFATGTHGSPADSGSGITPAAAGLQVGTESLWAAPAALADDDDDGCGQHSGAAGLWKCCSGAACLMMHIGIAPFGVLSLPPPEAAAVLIPCSLLAEGIGQLPALRPPRASV